MRRLQAFYIAIVFASAALLFGQTAPTDAAAQSRAAAKSKQIAQNFASNARTLTLYDKSGTFIRTIGERGMFQQPVLSPDNSRIAVIKRDLGKSVSDLWVFDLATSVSTRITNNRPEEDIRTPLWSPDGRSLIFIRVHTSFESIFRNTADGKGTEDMLCTLPGAGLQLTDWSPDGRFITYASLQLGGNTLWVLPLEHDRKPVEIARSEFQMLAASISPDSHFLAYLSNATGKINAYVRPFDPETVSFTGPARQVSSEIAIRPLRWGTGGTLYYTTSDHLVKVVSPPETPAGAFPEPQVAFSLPSDVPGTAWAGFGDIALDTQELVYGVAPAAPSAFRQVTMYDRTGNVITTIGPVDLVANPSLSPDGKRVAVVKTDQKSGDSDIWTYDIATGQGRAVTADKDSDSNPFWFPDGRVAYVSLRGMYRGVYRKAFDGSGVEELLFRYTAGAGLELTDVSPDGKFLSFSSGGVVLVVPLTGTDPLARKAVEFTREEYATSFGRFSPDSRFVAYTSDETRRNELFIKPMNPQTGEPMPGNWQVTKEGAGVMTFWRNDSKELLYLINTPPPGAEAQIMAVDVSLSPNFQAGTAKLLFKLTGPLFPGKNVTPDGQRFVFAILAPSVTTGKQ